MVESQERTLIIILVEMTQFKGLVINEVTQHKKKFFGPTVTKFFLLFWNATQLHTPFKNWSSFMNDPLEKNFYWITQKFFKGQNIYFILNWVFGFPFSRNNYLWGKNIFKIIYIKNFQTSFRSASNNSIFWEKQKLLFKKFRIFHFIFSRLLNFINFISP